MENNNASHIYAEIFMNNTKESKLLHFLYNPYLTSTTRYLLVLQKICGLVMRNVYCLLASRTSV